MNNPIKKSKMKYLKYLLTSAVTFLIGTQLLFAQVQQQPQPPSPDDVTDQELTLFANALIELEPIQEKLQGEIQKVVEDEDMNMERFQQIMIAMQNPQMADQAEITDEEQEKIGNMQPKVVELQMGAQEEMVNTIEENGLNVQRYQQIIMGVQQHQELAERLQDIIATIELEKDDNSN